MKNRSKLIVPSMNTKNGECERVIRTSGDLVQVINVVCLTNTQYGNCTLPKNITACSSSCKNQEVSGIPSFTCREGKDCIVLEEEEEEEEEWIDLPHHIDIEQFICKKI